MIFHFFFIVMMIVIIIVMLVSLNILSSSRAYYSPEGLEYTMGRVPVGGTDFSTRPYTYDDLPPGQTDPLLRKFALAKEDLKVKVRKTDGTFSVDIHLCNELNNYQLFQLRHTKIKN